MNKTSLTQEFFTNSNEKLKKLMRIKQNLNQSLTHDTETDVNGASLMKK